MKKNYNYRIFRVEASKNRTFPKKITMLRIYAKDNDDAYSQLKEYVRVANKQYRYYVERWTPHVVVINGKQHEFSDFIEAYEFRDRLRPWYKKIYDWFDIRLYRLFIIKPKDAFYWCRNMLYLMKNKQEYSASWTIDDKLLDLIMFNLPILKKYKHTLSWAMLEKAYSEKHKCSESDAKKYFSTNVEYDKDIKDKSVELEHKMFDELIDNIKAYKYYMGGYDEVKYGCNDPKDKWLIETDKKLRNTLPLIKGSYDDYDYKKLNALTDKYWNKIWETVRKYGREFND